MMKEDRRTTPDCGLGSLFIFLLGLSLAVTGPVQAGQETKPGWQLEWEKTVDAAEKEGQVSVYTFGGTTNLPIESGVFQKRFPEIKVVMTSGDPVPRILAERRAGKYLADVAIGGFSTPWQLYLAKALDSIRNAIILPEVADESKWWQGKHFYTDPERSHAFAYIGNPDFGSVFYNSNLINPKEFQSFRDFLHPKWKGKIIARDIRTPGAGGVTIRVFYYNPKLGPDFIRRLFSEMDITLYRDRRQGVNWLATGKYSLCFFCNNSDVMRAKEQGLPVDEFGAMSEGLGLSTSSGNVGLLNRAPHPNAAKVFLNWLLSREGQMVMQTETAKVGAIKNSLRIDIPKDMIPPEQRLKADLNYIEVDIPERMSMEPMLKIFNEALAKREK